MKENHRNRSYINATDCACVQGAIVQDLFPFPPLESSGQRNSPMTFPNGRYFLIPQMQTCSRPVRLQSRFTVTPRSGWEVIADLVGGGASMLFEPTAAAVDTAPQKSLAQNKNTLPHLRLLHLLLSSTPPSLLPSHNPSFPMPPPLRRPCLPPSPSPCRVAVTSCRNVYAFPQTCQPSLLNK